MPWLPVWATVRSLLRQGCGVVGAGVVGAKPAGAELIRVEPVGAAPVIGLGAAVAGDVRARVAGDIGAVLEVATLPTTRVSDATRDVPPQPAASSPTASADNCTV